MMDRFRIVFLVLVLAASQAQAQVNMFKRIRVPVTLSGVSLKEPFAGGLNNPQFSPVDLNNDGVLDLVIFDRGGDVVLTYLNANLPGQAEYNYAPEFACNFPVMSDYALLRDYNKDGAADIFTASYAPGTQEMQVYRGYFEDNMLHFTPFIFSYPACPTCNPLYIWYPDEDQPGFWNNLPVNKTDVPGIDDVDGDGDLDILAFPSGNSTNLWFFKNTSVELGYGLDSLKFRALDQCWGRFYENGFEPCKAKLSADPNVCASGFAPGEVVEDRETRHPGATLMPYDEDGDGDKDLVFGNISFECLGKFTNGGTPQQAWMTALDSVFPSNDVQVILYNFPAAFYLDANNDGKKDMLVSSNSKTIGEDRRNVWLYENTAPTANKHQFNLQTKRFLVEDMIDLGTSTHPAFADVNADGLMDLIVGNVGFFTPATINNPGTPNNASLYYFANVGTSTEPAFDLVNSNWLNLAQYAPNDFDFSPTFGDLDNDGDLDLLVGNNGGGLYYFRNAGGAGNPMILEQDTDPIWISMDVGVASTPAIYDIDQDGKPDIIMGERQGNINYFKNTGTPTAPKFANLPTLQNLGKVDTDVPGFSVGYSTPVFLPTPDGIVMISGSQLGPIEMYSGLSATSDSFPKINTSWGNVDEGSRTHPTLADLDEDGILEMVVGNQRGGLSLFKTTLVDCTVATKTQQSAPLKISIAPNPANGWVKVDIQALVDQRTQWRVYNLLGQVMEQGTTQSSTFSVNVSAWEPGVYFMELVSGARQGTVKLMVK
jgi:hypothetical protein